jgi:hypothetical protein
MSTASTLTVDDFIEVRTEVARTLGQDSQTQAPTRERQAEKLMRLGYINFEAVLLVLHPPAPPEPSEGEKTVTRLLADLDTNQQPKPNEYAEDPK